jgi:hypothetical protein
VPAVAYALDSAGSIPARSVQTARRAKLRGNALQQQHKARKTPWRFNGDHQDAVHPLTGAVSSAKECGPRSEAAEIG